MHRADPTRVWYLLQGGSALGDTLVWVLAPVYFVKTVGMSPLQLVLVPEAWAGILGWAVWGFGYTFTSGATDAWLADEIGVENVRPAYLRSAQLARVVSLFGIAASVGLGLVALWLPIVVGGCVIVAVGAALAVLMPETGFRPAEHREAEGAAR